MSIQVINTFHMLDRTIKVFKVPILILIALLGVALFPISILIYIFIGFNIPDYAVKKLVELSNDDDHIDC